MIRDDRIWFGIDGNNRPVPKRFLSEVRQGIVASGWWPHEDAGHTDESKKEIQRIFDGESPFDTPKPIRLLRRMLQIATKKDDLVMDFFAGSATTAHAVMELNAEDGGNRKWICVQLPEKCKPDTEAAKAGFVTIADIAKERIRRAGRKIREENADKQLDTGFKVFKLDESNFKVWDTQIDGMAQLEQQLLDFVDNVRPGARSEDLLYELILKTGLELNVAIEAKEAGGGVYHRIGYGSLIICLADTLTEPLLAAMLVDRPEKIIVLDRAFAGNDQLKTNMLLQAEQAGVKEFTII
jgi:adenine-specific DNA-methyltransferase